MKPTFDHTVSILVKAYLNDTLEHGNYCACAVGNMIADAVGANIIPSGVNYGSKYMWEHPVYRGGEWYCNYDGEESRSQIKASGYSKYQIWRIENAFERMRHSEGDAMFNGLMSVVDVLASIHNVDLSTKEKAKLLFVK